MPPYLTRRDGGRYSARVRIPNDLIAHYRSIGVKSGDIVRALGTSDPAKARQRRLPMLAIIEAEFQAIRAAPVVAPPRPPGPSPEWLAKTPEQQAEYRRQADEYEMGYQDWQEQDHLDFEYNPERRARTEERQALRAEWEAEKAEERAASKAEKRAKGHITLSAVVDKWAAEMTPGHRSLTRARKVIEDFEALNGKLTVQSVTKQHVLAYRAALAAEGQKPANGNLLIGWVTSFSTLLPTAIATASARLTFASCNYLRPPISSMRRRPETPPPGLWGAWASRPVT